jgi:hypothetical protein
MLCRQELDSRQVRQRTDDYQGAPNEAVQLDNIERVGVVAGGVTFAALIRRVTVDLVELIEKCASGMLLAGIAEFLNDARQRVLGAEAAGICKGAVALDHGSHFGRDVSWPSNSNFVEVQQVDDLGYDATFAWFLNIELYDFRSHFFYAGANIG